MTSVADTPDVCLFFYGPDLSGSPIIYSGYRFKFEVMLSVRSASNLHWHSVLVAVP